MTRMTRLQWTAIIGALVLFVCLYFVLDRRPPRQEALEKTRALAATATDPTTLIREGKAALVPAEKAEILELEGQLESAGADSARLFLLERLSGRWYAFGHPAVAGHYAQEIAGVRQSEEAWSIAGTTFTLCLQSAMEAKIRDYCAQQAVSAFENAISLNPEEVAHRLNLALVYTENPPASEPMKGVLMLRTLNQDHPENVPILNNLGRLAIQTGQYEKALERLEKALEYEPGNAQTVCLLQQAYEGAGLTDKAQEFANRCAARN